MSQRVAAIDCGTNSIRLVITDIAAGEATDLVREARLVRLGQDVDRTGALAPEAIERTIEACREYAEMIAKYSVARLGFAATSATRDASNSAEFSAAVESVLGVKPKVLSGEQEAAATFAGAVAGLGAGTTTVVDIGGGSTEFVQGERVPDFAQSVDVGAVRMTERFLPSDPPTGDEVAACAAEVDRVIAPVLGALELSERCVLVAGTATTLAADALGLNEWDREQIHGARISIESLRSTCARMWQRTVGERRDLGFMHPGRADVIGGGAVVIDRILAAIRLTEPFIHISERDILDGIALSLADGEWD